MSGRSLRALVVCVALAIAHTWPLMTAPAALSRHDNADTTLNTWIVWWVARELPRDPRHLFDAPIFVPERRTLAYSEPLLPQGLMAVPLTAAGLPPTAVYNLLVLIGFALSAWAAWRLVAGWTGDEWAGAVAGAAYAFNAHLLARFGHLQAIHAEFLPLVLVGLDRLAVRARWRDGVTLAAGLVLVGLTSIYQLAFAAGATVVGLGVRVGEWRRHAAPTLRAATLGVVLAVVVLAPVLWQYYAVSREWGLTRTLDDALVYAATGRDYLVTGGRLHQALWSAGYTSASALFPGVTVVLLALAALTGAREQRGRVWMLVGIGVGGLLMSFGPRLPIYRWLFDLVLLLQATRVPSRWGILVLTALALLAGLGLAAIRGRRTGRGATAIGAVAFVLVTAEAWRAPMAYTPTPPVPAIYTRLAALDAAVLLEFPIYPAAQANLNAPYLLAQTVHGKPIVAGYSGIATPGYTARLADLGTFPAEAAHRRLREIGVTHVVLHLAPLRAGFGQAALDAVDAVPWLSRDLEDAETRVYRVRQ